MSNWRKIDDNGAGNTLKALRTLYSDDPSDDTKNDFKPHHGTPIKPEVMNYRKPEREPVGITTRKKR